MWFYLSLTNCLLNINMLPLGNLSSIIWLSKLIIYPRLFLSFFQIFLMNGFPFLYNSGLFPLSPPTLPAFTIPWTSSISVSRQAFPSFPKYESPFAYFHNVKYYCGQISELSLQNTVISTQSFFFIDLLFCMCFWLTAQLQRIV